MDWSRKPYLVFAFSQYYPSGGWKDFRGAFATKEEALVAAANTRADWWQIVNLETGRIIVTSDSPYEKG